MRKRITILFIQIMILLSGFSLYAQKYEVGKSYYGFKLVEKKFIKEYDTDGLYFEHIKSGAKVFKIASQDAHKTFTVSFHTNPESDSGTPHIIEHMAVSGSQKYPVKDLLFSLHKGSLLTFISATTTNEFTSYPMSSLNEREYFKAMDIYMDGVFNPLFMTDKRIFQQEGWHYELEDKEKPITYNGIVYNEMKAGKSSPESIIYFATKRHLFPDNGYQWNAGGDPDFIPNLTYDMVKDYYKRYYHPSNCLVLLYGNAPLENELSLLDKQYFSKYTKIVIPEIFPLHKPFKEMKEKTEYYPVQQGTKIDGKTYISLSFATDEIVDIETRYSVFILLDILFNREDAPVKNALKKAGIGKDVKTSFGSFMQPAFILYATNCDSKDKDKFKEIVLNTLQEEINKKFDKKAIEGSINQYELYYKELQANRGISANFSLLTGWTNTNNLFGWFETNTTFAKMRKNLKTDYYENIIERYFTKNPYSLMLVLEPKPGLGIEKAREDEKKLTEYKSTLSGDEIANLVKETKELKEHQKKGNSDEEKLKITSVSKKDVNKKADWYGIDKRTIAGLQVLHHNEFTNNVIYSRLMFDLRVLPSDMLPYASLLADVLLNLNSKNYTFSNLKKAMDYNACDISFQMQLFKGYKEGMGLIPKFSVKGKTTEDRLDKLYEFIVEILFNTEYTDSNLLKDIIEKKKKMIESELGQLGNVYVQKHLLSYFDDFGVVQEITSGIDYYRFLSGLLEKYSEKQSEIIQKIKKVSDLLFNKNNLTVALTCDKNNINATDKYISLLAEKIPSKSIKNEIWNFDPEKKNEGFMSTSLVQYVNKGYNFDKLGYKWNGRIKVLAYLLSIDYMLNRIRLVGGAYGASCGISNENTIIFSSYRDPGLSKTIETINLIPKFIDSLSYSEWDFDRVIVGLIASIDRPVSAEQRGDIAVANYFKGYTQKDLQKERDEILGATLSDIKGMKKMISDVLDQNAICVYGNEEKINAEKHLFKKVERFVK